MTSCAGCCAQPGQLVYQPEITRIDLYPLGTRVEICPDQDIPRVVVVKTKIPALAAAVNQGKLVYRQVIER